MAERSKKSRRWPWVVVALGLLLVFAAVAWRFRPLNATERRLIGEWSARGNKPAPLFLALNVDRTYVYGLSTDGRPPRLPATGRWTASTTTLVLKPDRALRHTLDLLLSNTPLNHPWRIHDLPQVGNADSELRLGTAAFQRRK